MNDIILTDEQLRKLQLEELEILKEVDRICRKNHIPYYLTAGTMLGAVRHNGFIPWDDDIDVSMLRHDYHRFCIACKKDLNKEKFFWQTWDTDSGYRYQYSRMRRNNTLYIRSGHENANHHNGINIDIFPVDKVPDNIFLCIIYKTGCEFFRKALYSPVGYIRSSSVISKAIYGQLKKINPDIIKKEFKNWIKFFATFSSERVDSVGFAYRHNLKSIRKLGIGNYFELYRGMKTSTFKHLKEYSFEGLKFYGPLDYDYYLKTIYGDYMTPPPKKYRDGDHKAVVIEFSDEEHI